MSDKNEKIEAAEAPKAKAHFDFTKLNTLAVVSLATAVTGFGSVAAVITGHISLAQLKKSNESGRGLALTGMILGYVGIAVWVLGGIGMAIARIFINQRYGVDLGGPMGGHMGGRGGFDGDDQGGMMGNGWQMPNGTQPEPVQTN
ncbi:unannotated protein [freshwater metagenome]|uniref:Unannotated protein n=1 Tax=freshwater metagenome TaxID=449393 RepID=A0A6J6J7X8_9ZZZZ|nr:DUF4190 domain-containing protein [Actinomycetota bacterium]